jgi:aspartyl/glutamyl-tRNA(Asn/Gln) amidotransferase C subunit
MQITKQELLALIRMSRLQLDDAQVDALMPQIDDILTYARRVKDVAVQLPLKGADNLPSLKNCNIFREDVVVRTDFRDIIAQAPESDQNYFVVPVILETT